MASSPNWSTGYEPSAAEWNAVLAGKADTSSDAPTYDISTSTIQLNGSFNIHFLNNLTGNPVTIYSPSPLLPKYNFFIKDITLILNPNAVWASYFYAGAVDGQSNALLIQTPGQSFNLFTPDGVSLYVMGS